MKNVRNTVATVTATTALVALCAFLGAGTATAATPGSRSVTPSAGITVESVLGTAELAHLNADEGWH
ncbi:hypothetical protein [Streptomyces sp. cmx-18-6]|uniref:hypothetical protein n=1 Tax=Streptomyces sp. cmx-18-6 TaxID=2790930 RepID=UPI00398042E1